MATAPPVTTELTCDLNIYFDPSSLRQCHVFYNSLFEDFFILAYSWQLQLHQCLCCAGVYSYQCSGTVSQGFVLASWSGGA